MAVTTASIDSFPLVKLLADVHGVRMQRGWCDGKYTAWRCGDEAGFMRRVNRLREATAQPGHSVSAVCYACLSACPAARTGPTACPSCRKPLCHFQVGRCPCRTPLCQGCAR